MQLPDPLPAPESLSSDERRDYINAMREAIREGKQFSAEQLRWATSLLYLQRQQSFNQQPASRKTVRNIPLEEI